MSVPADPPERLAEILREILALCSEHANSAPGPLRPGEDQQSTGENGDSRDAQADQCDQPDSLNPKRS
jgi:hypothetical protein